MTTSPTPSPGSRAEDLVERGFKPEGEAQIRAMGDHVIEQVTFTKESDGKASRSSLRGLIELARKVTIVDPLIRAVGKGVSGRKDWGELPQRWRKYDGDYKNLGKVVAKGAAATALVATGIGIFALALHKGTRDFFFKSKESVTVGAELPQARAKRVLQAQALEKAKLMGVNHTDPEKVATHLDRLNKSCVVNAEAGVILIGEAKPNEEEEIQRAENAKKLCGLLKELFGANVLNPVSEATLGSLREVAKKMGFKGEIGPEVSDENKEELAALLNRELSHFGQEEIFAFKADSTVHANWPLGEAATVFEKFTKTTRPLTREDVSTFQLSARKKGVWGKPDKAQAELMGQVLQAGYSEAVEKFMEYNKEKFLNDPSHYAKGGLKDLEPRIEVAKAILNAPDETSLLKDLNVKSLESARIKIEEQLGISIPHLDSSNFDEVMRYVRPMVKEKLEGPSEESVQANLGGDITDIMVRHGVGPTPTQEQMQAFAADLKTTHGLEVKTSSIDDFEKDILSLMNEVGNTNDTARKVASMMRQHSIHLRPTPQQLERLNQELFDRGIITSPTPPLTETNYMQILNDLMIPEVNTVMQAHGVDLIKHPSDENLDELKNALVGAGIPITGDFNINTYEDILFEIILNPPEGIESRLYQAILGDTEELLNYFDIQPEMSFRPTDADYGMLDLMQLAKYGAGLPKSKFGLAALQASVLQRVRSMSPEERRGDGLEGLREMFEGARKGKKEHVERFNEMMLPIIEKYKPPYLVFKPDGKVKGFTKMEIDPRTGKLKRNPTNIGPIKADGIVFTLENSKKEVTKLFEAYGKKYGTEPTQPGQPAA